MHIWYGSGSNADVSDGLYNDSESYTKPDKEMKEGKLLKAEIAQPQIRPYRYGSESDSNNNHSTGFICDSYKVLIAK